jgi:diketogulonate reductase-like aldo/keto reductase
MMWFGAVSVLVLTIGLSSPVDTEAACNIRLSSEYLLSEDFYLRSTPDQNTLVAQDQHAIIGDFYYENGVASRFIFRTFSKGHVTPMWVIASAHTADPHKRTDFAEVETWSLAPQDIPFVSPLSKWSIIGKQGRIEDSELNIECIQRDDSFILASDVNPAISGYYAKTPFKSNRRPAFKMKSNVEFVPGEALNARHKLKWAVGPPSRISASKKHMYHVGSLSLSAPVGHWVVGERIGETNAIDALIESEAQDVRDIHAVPGAQDDTMGESVHSDHSKMYTLGSSFSWQDAVDHCSSLKADLCESRQYCPPTPSNSNPLLHAGEEARGTVPFFGVQEGRDLWAPVKDTPEDWIQIGDKPHVPCETHVEKGWNTPSWSSDGHTHPMKGTVACCSTEWSVPASAGHWLAKRDDSGGARPIVAAGSIANKKRETPWRYDNRMDVLFSRDKAVNLHLLTRVFLTQNKQSISDPTTAMADFARAGVEPGQHDASLVLSNGVSFPRIGYEAVEMAQSPFTALRWAATDGFDYLEVPYPLASSIGQVFQPSLGEGRGEHFVSITVAVKSGSPGSVDEAMLVMNEALEKSGTWYLDAVVLQLEPDFKKDEQALKSVQCMWSAMEAHYAQGTLLSLGVGGLGLTERHWNDVLKETHVTPHVLREQQHPLLVDFKKMGRLLQHVTNSGSPPVLLQIPSSTPSALQACIDGDESSSVCQKMGVKAKLPTLLRIMERTGQPMEVVVARWLMTLEIFPLYSPSVHAKGRDARVNFESIAAWDFLSDEINTLNADIPTESGVFGGANAKRHKSATASISNLGQWVW